MTDIVCETKNLSKRYRDTYALKNVSMAIHRGEIYGLIGENGAGKTTLHTENQPVWIWGEPLICKRIIENLIANACHYADGFIEIGIHHPGVFTIANATNALPDDIDVTQLFDKFYTADPARQAGHSGLGLYIVKVLLAQIGGRVGDVRYADGVLSIAIAFAPCNGEDAQG